MEQNSLSVEGIPSLLWGTPSDKLLIAVHGNQSNKADVTIEMVATIAVEKGYQVLSFDLPEHGERKGDARICDAQNCAGDLARIMKYARAHSDHISVFGCSIGAYFAMLAYQDEPIQQALFLSPVVDMKRLINNMMVWFDVSEERLKREREVPTPINTLYWDYYQYVLKHPVEWKKPTALLYGEKDELCEYESIKVFAESCHARVTILENSGHFFHTEKQLDCHGHWLHDCLTA